MNMARNYSQEVRRAKKALWMGEDPDVAANHTANYYQRLGERLKELGCPRVVVTPTSVEWDPPNGQTSYQVMQRADAEVKRS